MSRNVSMNTSMSVYMSLIGSRGESVIINMNIRLSETDFKRLRFPVTVGHKPPSGTLWI